MRVDMSGSEKRSTESCGLYACAVACVYNLVHDSVYAPRVCTLVLASCHKRRTYAVVHRKMYNVMLNYGDSVVSILVF